MSLASNIINPINIFLSLVLVAKNLLKTKKKLKFKRKYIYYIGDTYLDYQFCRNDVIDPTRPNAGAASPYARRHILVAFMQDIPSSEYFSNAYWQGTYPRSRYIWSQTADVLIFSDGIFLGTLWWQGGVNQLSDVPRVGDQI